jgi:hypothetical protein
MKVRSVFVRVDNGHNFTQIAGRELIALGVVVLAEF